jgi:hypothetical protein
MNFRFSIILLSLVCHNCETSIWDRQLINWNVRRAIPYGPDRSLLLCGCCLKGFKQKEDYCTICFKLYADGVPKSNKSFSKVITEDGEEIVRELPTLGNVDEKSMVRNFI